MAVTVLDAEIRIAYGTEQEWVDFQALNPTTPITRGSLCVVADDAVFDNQTNYRIKIADGSTLWANLPYLLKRVGIGDVGDRPDPADDGMVWYDTTSDTLSVYSVTDAGWENIAGGSGEANTGTNVGGAVEIYKGMNGTVLEFKTLVLGGGLTFSSQTDTLTINGTGKNNVGTVAGIGTPDVNDDSNDGYRVGSRWYNTDTDDEWVCTDATVGAADWHPIPAGGGGGGTGDYFSWEFDTVDQAGTDPGSGKFKLDNATPANVSNIYISDTSDSVAATSLYAAIDEGMIIYIRQQGDSSKHIMLRATGPASNNSGWHTIPVDYMTGSTLPDDASTCGFDFISVELYSNTDSMPSTVGGYSAGTNFNTPQTMQQMWDGLLYPYVQGNVTDLTVKNNGSAISLSTRIIGESVAFDEYLLAFDDIGKFAAGSVDLLDGTGPSAFLSNQALQTQHLFTERIATLTSQGTWRFQARAEDSTTNNNRNSPLRSINFRIPYYYGRFRISEVADEDSLTESEILNLVATDFAGTNRTTPYTTYSFASVNPINDSFPVVIWPAVWGTNPTITDASGFPIATAAIYTVNMSNYKTSAGGGSVAFDGSVAPVSYAVLRMANPIVGAATIKLAV